MSALKFSMAFLVARVLSRSAERLVRTALGKGDRCPKAVVDEVMGFFGLKASE